MGINLKRLNGNDSVSLYALQGDSTNEEYTDFLIWLDAHCRDDYKIDRYHLIIGTKSELFLALRWKIND